MNEQRDPARAGDRSPPTSPPALTRWLQDSLAEKYDGVLDERLPREWQSLIEVTTGRH